MSDIVRNKNKNDWKSMFDFYIKYNETPVSKGVLMGMAYTSTRGVDSAIPQSLWGELDDTFYYVYDYTDKSLGELVDLRQKLKFSNNKVDVTIVVNGDVLYKERLPEELQNATFHQALKYVFNNDEVEAFDIRPKTKEMAKGGKVLGKIGNITFTRGRGRGMVKDVYFKNDDMPSHYISYSDNIEEINEGLKSWSKIHKKDFNQIEKVHFAEGGNLKAIAKKFERNENNNAHSENVVLLAKHFGTKEELAEANSILKKHNEEGSLSSENGRKRYALYEKLMKKARVQMSKEGIKFSTGGGVGGGKVYVLSGYSAEANEDSYEEGELGFAGSWDEKESKTFSTKQELIDYINDKIIYTEYEESHFDWETGNGKNIQTDVLCSYDDYSGYYPADKKEIELWKKGKKKLYNVHYFIYVMAVIPTEYAEGGMMSNWSYSIGGL